MKILKLLVQIIIVIFPWVISRKLLIFFYKYELHPLSHIGFAWIFPKVLIMKEGAKIDHFTVAVHLDKIELNELSSIGRSNWITGFSSSATSRHFQHQSTRCSELFLGVHSSITKNHHIDCTSPVLIGKFVTIAGYHSQILTHSIDLFQNRQNSNSIIIDDYTFVGTNCVILGGAKLPAYSVLGAKSLLNKNYSEQWKLYAGVPAIPVKNISREAKYFVREQGFVY